MAKPDRESGTNFKKFILFILLFLLGVAIFLRKTRNDSQSKASAPKNKKNESEVEKSEVREVALISVYDNYQISSTLKSDYGFGTIIKSSNKILLFDTGGDSDILLSNMKEMNIAPASVDKVIISHSHSDHKGGLKGFLEKNSDVQVYIPRSFPSSVKKMIKSRSAELVCVDKSMKITDRVYTTGEISGPPEEQSLIIKSERGLILMTGCSHPGIVNVTNKAKEIFPEEDLYLVVGGLHLNGVSENKLNDIVSDLKKLGVEKVAPSHCSGDKCRELFKKEYREDFIEYGVGKVIEVRKRAEGGRVLK